MQFRPFYRFNILPSVVSATKNFLFEGFKMEKFGKNMNFPEETDLKKLWKSDDLGTVDPLMMVKTLFQSFARILDTNYERKMENISVTWVFKQLYEKGLISCNRDTNGWSLEAESITDVFINNTKVIWFPESIQNPNLGKFKIGRTIRIFYALFDCLFF